jgi:hypothetical protein
VGKKSRLKKLENSLISLATTAVAPPQVLPRPSFHKQVLSRVGTTTSALFVTLISGGAFVVYDALQPKIDVRLGQPVPHTSLNSANFGKELILQPGGPNAALQGNSLYAVAVTLINGGRLSLSKIQLGCFTLQIYDNFR